MLETKAMKIRHRVVIVVVAALTMIGLFVLLPFINRTEPMAEFPPVQFEHPNLTIASLPVVSPPAPLGPEKAEPELDAERPELDTTPELIEIKFDQAQNPLTMADGMVISDDTKFFVPLVAFDTVDLDQQRGPGARDLPGYRYGEAQGGTGAWARIRFVVEADGSVSQARIDAASDRDFGEVGLDAIRNWPFTASMTGTKSVRTWVVQPFPLRAGE